MLKAGRKGDLHGFLRLDDALNQQAAHAARNEVAANAVAALHAVSRRFWFHHQSDSPLSAETVALHAAVAEAIGSGDETRAAASSDALIDHLFEFARATLPDT
jgi:DNA-binding GntR family transcriptional regulator